MLGENALVRFCAAVEVGVLRLGRRLRSGLAQDDKSKIKVKIKVKINRKVLRPAARGSG